MRGTRSKNERSTSGRGLVSVFCVAVLVSGCASTPGDHDDADGPAPVVEVARIIDGYDCLAPNLGDWALPPGPADSSDPQHPDAPAAGRVPAGFTPTAAVRCERGANIEDTEGQWTAVAAVTLTGDLTPLLEALAEPDDRPTLGPCTADAELVPPLWLVDANGRAIHAHYPRDECAKTKRGTHTALAGLSVRETTTLKQRLMVPRAALDSGCEAVWAAPPHQEAPQPVSSFDSSGVVGASPVGPSPMAASVLAEVDGIRWCRYVVEAAPPAAADPGKGAGTAEAAPSSFGRFVAGGALDPVSSRLIADAAASAPVSRSCEEQATSFLALWPTIEGRDVGTAIIVELDGCELLRNNVGSTHPLPPDVLEMLSALTAG